MATKAKLPVDTSGQSTHGGAREGSGRKRGYSAAKARALDTFGQASESGNLTTTTLKKARAIARKEEALANQAELKFKIDSGEYLSRTAFREASATLLAQLAQGLRSLPDQLERKHSLSPEVTQSVEATIDGSLATLAAGLELFTAGPA